MSVQLSPVNFLRLMDGAERRVIPKGAEIKKGGAPHKEVILIVEGTAEVSVVDVMFMYVEERSTSSRCGTLTPP